MKSDHTSYPTNPRLAEPLYQAGYIERFGTGTGEIFRLTKEAGLNEPEFDLEEGFKVTIWRSDAATGQATGQVSGQVSGQVTDHVAEEIKRVLLVFFKEMKSADIQNTLQLKHREYFRDNYLNPALDQGFVEMIFQETPNNPNQKYRLTQKGIALKDNLLLGTLPNKQVAGEFSDHDSDHDSDYDTDHDELVIKLITVILNEKSRPELMRILDLKHSGNFRNNYLYPALEAGLVEMTLPDTPKSKNQKYRLSQKGFVLKNRLELKRK